MKGGHATGCSIEPARQAQCGDDGPLVPDGECCEHSSQWVGVTCMSSATSLATSAYTEQPAPGAETALRPTAIPEELWTVLILSVILWVLLAWRAIEEAGEGSGGDRDSSTWFPPF